MAAILDSMDAAAERDSTGWVYAQRAAMRDAQAAVYAGAAAEYYSRAAKRPDDVYSREILDVDQETPTRAVVLTRIKNISPIPPDAVVESWAAEVRRDGAEYRYHLELTDSVWKVTQVESWREYSKEWGPIFSTTPSVPTNTDPLP